MIIKKFSSKTDCSLTPTFSPSSHSKEYTYSTSDSTNLSISSLPSDSIDSYTLPLAKAKDYRLNWLAENVRRSDISPLARCVLAWLITKRQWRTDKLMIAGKCELAKVFNVHKRTIDRCVSELTASQCLRLVKQGGSLLGQKREANIYALGSAFNGIPPRFPTKGKDKELPVAQMSPVAKTPLVTKTLPVEKTSNDQGRPCPPLPIVHPNHTHTNNVVLALSKENWLKRGKETYPDWNEGNRMGAFHTAEAKRVNGTWPSYQDKCYHLRKTSAKEAPKVASTHKDQRPKRTPSQPQRSQCESPRLPTVDYNNPQTLGDQIYTALKEGLSLIMIKANADAVLYKDAYSKAEARFAKPRRGLQDSLNRSIPEKPSFQIPHK